jgi:tetratricopeptide (TPR) repeat protein
MSRLVSRGGAALVWLALALSGCGSALQAEDTATQAAVKRSRELYDDHQYQAARDKAAEALKKAPDNAQALYLRGLAELSLDAPADARNDLEAAQKADPLTLFAPNKSEFETALKTAREKAPTNATPNTPPIGQEPKGLNPTAPPAKPGEPPAKPGEPPAKAGPPTSGADPLIALVQGPNRVLEDRSEASPKIIGPDQFAVLDTSARKVNLRAVIVKLLVLKAGADPQKEADRLFDAAKLDGHDLLVVATPDGKIGACNPSLAPAVIKDAIARAVAENSKESLARKLVAVIEDLGAKVVPPPPLPPTTPPPPLPVMPEPAAPPPHHGLPRWAVPALGGVGGLLVVLLLAGLLRRALALRRLARGFSLARPHLEAAADALSRLSAALFAKRDRAAEVALGAAELAFFEAVTMLDAAQVGRTADTARVERAIRLLDESTTKVGDGETALADAAERAPAPLHACWFTARPIHDRQDADLVAVRWQGEERGVLACREAGEILRRGGVPQVRAVAGPGAPRHWATAPDFDPAFDFYHDRHGRLNVAPRALAAVFFDDPAGRAFVRLDGRPDYRLEL